MSADGSSILIIANPAAGSGTGTETGRRAVAEFEVAINAQRTGGFFAGAEVNAAFLGSPEETRSLVENSAGRRAVLAVGGDGLVHLVVNALMKVPEHDRPVFGVIPAGTGNDYARALGLPLDVRKSVSKVVHSEPHPVDVGLCNGEYYAETLSFGIDAAIALDTVRRRQETGRTDAGVYFSSGIDQLRNHLVSYKYRGMFDDVAVEGESITFAAQIGPYYGGGFKICPGARLDSGDLDICISHPPVGILRALYVFIRAKNGKHVRMKPIELAQAKHVVLDFDEEPPCQIDGEPLHSKHFDITCLHDALHVVH